jgi:hypothetical protein
LPISRFLLGPHKKLAALFYTHPVYSSLLIRITLHKN